MAIKGANGLVVNWNPDNGQVNLNDNDVGNRNDNLGVRPAVRVALRIKPLGGFIHPPNIRPTSLQIALVWNKRV